MILLVVLIVPRLATVAVHLISDLVFCCCEAVVVKMALFLLVIVLLVP